MRQVRGAEALEQALYRNLYREGAVAGDASLMAQQVIKIAQRVTACEDASFLDAALPDMVLRCDDIS